MDGKLKKHLVKFAVVLTIFFIYLNISYSHFNVLDSCFVKIKAPGLNSRKSEIKEAIKYLKSTDKEAYKNFCRQTDSIIETSCMGSDWHLDGKVRGQDSPGCYIKGSKTIYLNPLILKSFSADKIAGLLKDYSRMGRDFWDSGL
ncbi:MAG: hypothetical protein UX02_C0001G0003 [Candidatus Moranbacteria bacterium GW2011_GWC1_45_18]|nr:MAG: hypothetical protein UT79_C0002G0394 [Candidatus Moranbacteria bacterium GW2011_GWC2_40_12]KKT34238.1 MAG: hypothetical protein UW19_C0001G0133 [Candidatus Moranbacteria bacterium GW2011_GWF2_44_10]KKT71423.1 MAG: hypothetical protein UW66_C0033G0001 [Candidatus Moranbacteria bacterium GW2011_GWF1_44_4]KKU00555.1 MAG: hypothetical protein UX02_C0001G0003 [Candidatus Moranbacteria bacterium GW2011_GWC1_45_18]OGI24403.1 MAG: hypothetical protein A2194_04990 [Candidatus Moranbacteria bacte